MSNTIPPRQLLLLAAGFVLWASALVALYGAHAIGCAFAWPPSVQRGILILLLAAHLAAIGWLAVRHKRRDSSSQHAPRSMAFVEYVGFGATIAAWAATLFTLAPSLILRLCI